MPSKPEIRRIVEGYAPSGMTRRGYCQKHNIPITTLDYWRRMHKSKPRLVEIAVETGERGYRNKAGGGRCIGVRKTFLFRNS